MSGEPGGPAARYVLAVDMGSGAVKTALVERSGRIAATATRPVTLTHLPGGGVEQDPEEWWDAVCEAGSEVVRRSGADPGAVLAVRCTTQWATTVAVDAAGHPISPAISWMDTRAGPAVRDLVSGPVSIEGYDVRLLPRWLRLTGGAPVRAGMDGFGHLVYLKRERPEVYGAASAFLEPMDYLNARLSGRVAASYGTMYPYWLTDNRDVERVRYDPVLVRRAGVDPAKLPELLPVDAEVGKLTAEAARRLGLRTETKVMAGMSDLQAAAVGAGIVEEGRGYFSIGTSSWLSCLVPAKKTDILHLIATMPAGLPGRHMVVAEQGPAGRCLEFLRDTLLVGGRDGDPPAPDEVFERFERDAASVPPGCDGLIFTPWLTGVLAPAGDAFTRSAFFNQSLTTSRAHYVRAVMEGVAYNLRWLKGHVERFSRNRFSTLPFIGGAALSPTWSQILADVLGCEVARVSEPRHANAAGAALAGFAALGEISPAEIPDRVEIAATHRPDPAAARVHDRRFEEFRRLYRRNRRLYAAINRGAG
ncbi:MAG: FGGY-family carbohydrate kinase [Solirubrobacterales bacterium]